MLRLNNLKEMEPYYIKKTNTYVFKDDIIINFTLNVDANIDASAWNITALSITARDIDAWDIDAFDIHARDIGARNIEAKNIDAKDIKYWAICIAYQSFKCKSVKGKRENSIHKCLDQEIEFVKD